jgi:hypothetical protein
MNVAAGQTARPSIASNFTTAARENQHPRLAGAIAGRPRRNLPERPMNMICVQETSLRSREPRLRAARPIAG